MTHPRRLVLREERSGNDSRHLWAYLDADGSLHVDGQDLGPATAMVSDDGEYEWFQTIAAADLPRLLELLGGEPGDDVLDTLALYAGQKSYEFERLLRASDIPVQRFST